MPALGILRGHIVVQHSRTSSRCTAARLDRARRKAATILGPDGHPPATIMRAMALASAAETARREPADCLDVVAGKAIEAQTYKIRRHRPRLAWSSPAPPTTATLNQPKAIRIRQRRQPGQVGNRAAEGACLGTGAGPRPAPGAAPKKPEGAMRLRWHRLRWRREGPCGTAGVEGADSPDDNSEALKLTLPPRLRPEEVGDLRTSGDGDASCTRKGGMGS